MSEEAKVLLVLLAIFLAIVLPIVFMLLRRAIASIHKRWPSPFLARVLAAFEWVGNKLGGKEPEPKPVKFVPAWFMDLAILVLLVTIGLAILGVVLHFLKSC